MHVGALVFQLLLSWRTIEDLETVFISWHCSNC